MDMCLSPKGYKLTSMRLRLHSPNDGFLRKQTLQLLKYASDQHLGESISIKARRVSRTLPPPISTEYNLASGLDHQLIVGSSCECPVFTETPTMRVANVTLIK